MARQRATAFAVLLVVVTQPADYDRAVLGFPDHILPDGAGAIGAR